MSFRALAAGAEHRLEVIVRFLAVLELYKQGVVDLTQFTNFGELLVRRLPDGETAIDALSVADWDEPGVELATADDEDDAELDAFIDAAIELEIDVTVAEVDETAGTVESIDALESLESVEESFR
jgi:segregation and condensation protein A